MTLRPAHLLLPFALCLSALAQPAAPHLQTPSAAALSPDSRLVAWTVGARNATQQLTVAELAHPAASQVITPPGAACSNSAPVWSPDSATLAFLSTCGATAPGQQQIFLYTPANKRVRQLTHLAGNLQELAWSPDGKRLGFLFVENATRSAGALDAMKPWSGVIGEDGVEIQRVNAVDVVTGTASFLTPANLHVYEFDWAPTSREITFIAANPPGENTWWIAKLYTQPTGAPNAPTVVLDPGTTSGPLHGLQIAVPRFSPDGSKIALIGGLMSDQGSTGGDIYVVDAKGGQPVDVTPGIDGTPSYETWTGSHTLGFIEDRRGHTLAVDWDTEKKAAIPGSTADLGEVSVGGGPIKDAVSFVPAGHGTVAFTMQGFTKAPEIWTLDSSGQTHQITHLNEGLHPAARTESRTSATGRL